MTGETVRSGNTTTPIESTRDGGERVSPGAREVPCLTLVYAVGEERRVGEVMLFPEPGDASFGRASSDLLSASLARRRPGLFERTGSLSATILSREQARFEASETVLAVENVGSLKMRVNGVRQKSATLAPGDLVEFEKCCGFLFTMAPAEMPALRFAYPAFPFGEADPFGIAGESAAIWAARAELAAHAQHDRPVLVLGETGTGKYPAAIALHGLSRRASGPFVPFNAATFTDELAALTMYGGLKDHPNSGTPATLGLVREASGGTLFLDEIGESSRRIQATMLVAFDPAGLFTVLGEQKPRRANARFVCATNRELDELKNDFGARFTAVVSMPPLASRLEDVPLIARQLVLVAAAGEGGEVARRFVRGNVVRLDRALIAKLVRLVYPANVRGLERFLVPAMLASPGDTIVATPQLDAAPTVARAPAALDDAHIQAALARHDGNVSAAARELGVKRDVLRRAMGIKT